MARRSFIESNRELTTNFVKAVIEGLYLMKRDKALAVRLIKKYLRLDDESASIGYDFYITKHGDGVLSLPEGVDSNSLSRKSLRRILKPPARRRKA